MLANALMDLAEGKTNGEINDAIVESAFEAVQVGRSNRMASVVKDGEWTSSFTCQQLPFSSLISRYLMPAIGNSVFCRAWIKMASGGTLIKSFRIPIRPHTIPYYNESDGRHGSSWVPWIIGLAGFGVLVNLAAARKTAFSGLLLRLIR